jgi:Tfp pilus assembly protein PilO
MKRLPPAKRNNLILAIMGAIATISLVYFFLIGPQNEQNGKLAAQTIAEQARLQLMKKAVLQAADTAKAVNDIGAQLNQMESDIATGDVFIWTYDTIRQFKAGYKLEIPNIGQPTQSEVDLIPNFPYKQIKFSIMGNGYYHDMGKFIADLENKFPHIRVINLAIDPAGTTGTGSVTEKLAFRMEIVALFKPNS